MRIRVPLIATMLAVLPGIAAAQDEVCRYEAERTAVVDATGAALLEVRARAGDLRIEGRQGLSEVRVTARACASDEDRLDEVQLLAERSGERVRVEAQLPDVFEWFSFGRAYTRLDMVLEVPAGIAADIDDSSGGIELRGLGELTLDDSSGGIEAENITGPAWIDDSSGSLCIEDVAGPVVIRDSSGSICVARVEGDVEIDDSSGGIDVREVAGSVELRDSSGSIHVEDTTGNVTVLRDSSGSIRVEDVQGDFAVLRDSSGGVSYRNVGGAVRIPNR
jgi:hypothetical protein